MTPASPEPLLPRLEDDAALDFFDALDESPALPQGASGAETAAYVLGGLLRRVPLERARGVVHAMPRLLQPLLEPALEAEERASTNAGRGGLTDELTDNLAVAPDRVDGLVATVLATARRHLPRAAVDSLAAALPDEVRGLWRDRASLH